MYIKKLSLKNIRSVSHFEMTFEKPAGWHVLIGENGSGKSTIVQAITVGLLGTEVESLQLPLADWIQQDQQSAQILLTIQTDPIVDLPAPNTLNFKAYLSIEHETNHMDYQLTAQTEGFRLWHDRKGGWFSAAFGPFRRFTDTRDTPRKVFKPRIQAHLSMLEADAPLRDSLVWLKGLQFKSLEKNAIATLLIKQLIFFINKSQLLPNGVQMRRISSDGIFFIHENHKELEINQLSDGFQAILSLVFELIRQLIQVYGENRIFKRIHKDTMLIDLPGVVLIDEIDAHLHPTWQARIGSWFTQYFPNIQFIVTTHSPLVCRACHDGSIWFLTKSGSMEIQGIDKERLIRGNILDAYGTALFGQGAARSEIAKRDLKRYASLDMLDALGKITSVEKNELVALQKIYSTDAPTSH